MVTLPVCYLQLDCSLVAVTIAVSLRKILPIEALDNQEKPIELYKHWNDMLGAIFEAKLTCSASSFLLFSTTRFIVFC